MIYGVFITMVTILSFVLASRPMPTWSYNSTHLPIGWFGANASGFENPSQLEDIAKYDIAIFGWQAFLSETNYSHEANPSSGFLLYFTHTVSLRTPC